MKESLDDSRHGRHQPSTATASRKYSSPRARTADCRTLCGTIAQVCNLSPSARNSCEPTHGISSQFGADVIKIEPPNVGDPLRVWRELDIDGTSPWFRSIGRNKKSVAIDLRKPQGREYVDFSVRATASVMLQKNLTCSIGWSRSWPYGAMSFWRTSNREVSEIKSYLKSPSFYFACF